MTAPAYEVVKGRLPHRACLTRLPLFSARYLGMPQQERETLATRKLQRFLRGWTDQSRVVVHLHTSSLCVNLLRFVSDAGRCSN